MRINKSLMFMMMLLISIVFVLGACSSDSATDDGGSSNETPDTSDSNDSGDSGSDSSGDSSENSDESSGKLFDEEQTLTMLNMSHGNWPYSEDQEQWAWLQEATNVKIEVDALEGEAYSNQVNLSVASGDLKDLYWAVDMDTFNKLGAQGAFINLMEHLDKMPNLKKALDENPGRKLEFMTADGKMYVAPTMGFYAAGQRLWLYRKDVFEENGLEIPKTYDEMYEVSKELKSIYPDSYPMTWRGGVRNLERMAPQFGINHSYYNDENGEYQFGPVQDKFKDLVTFLNKMYEEELISPTWLTDKAEQWVEMVSSEQVFMTNDYIGRIDYFNNKVREANPNFTMDFMPPPKGCADCPAEQMYFAGPANGMAIASTTENLDVALAYVDWFFSPEGTDIGTWGKDGGAFTKASGEWELTEEWKGTTDFTEIRKATGIFTNGTFLKQHTDNPFTFMTTDENRAAMQEALPYMADPWVRQPALTDAERTQTTVVVDSINTKMEENIAKFIMGERSLDEWDQHVEELYNLGLQDVLDTYTEAYQRMQQ